MLIENNGKGHSDGFAPIAIAGASRGETGKARVTGREWRPSDGGVGMSWLDRLRGGFAKTADKVAENLTGLVSRSRRSTPRRSTTSRKR